MAWLVCAARMIASIVVTVFGLLLAIVSMTAKERPLWLLAVSAVVGIGGVLTWPRMPNSWRREPPTDRQLAFARDLGISVPRNATKGEVSDMIETAKQARGF